MEPRELLVAYIGALNARDWDRLPDLVSDDYVEEWPQTGEVVRGVDNLRAIFEEYPGTLAAGAFDESAVDVIGTEDRYVIGAGMMPICVRVQGSGEMFTLTYLADYPDGSRWYVVMVARIAGHRLRRAHTYFAPLLDAPEWRRQHVELSNLSKDQP